MISKKHMIGKQTSLGWISTLPPINIDTIIIINLAVCTLLHGENSSIVRSNYAKHLIPCMIHGKYSRRRGSV